MLPFHKRFDIDIPIEEARERFVNRSLNAIFTDHKYQHPLNTDARIRITTSVGTRYIEHVWVIDYYVKSFQDCLKVIEEAYDMEESKDGRDDLKGKILQLLDMSETDLGVRWVEGHFVRTGAPLLDETLVNSQLRWLEGNKLSTIRTPFEKSLRHLLEAEADPARLGDVVTDAYEALEALSKVVTGRPGKDLSGNAEMLAKRVNASAEMQGVLKQYVAYANRFRHAESEVKPRPSVSAAEAEYFVYMTGGFIRLAIESGALPQEGP